MGNICETLHYTHVRSLGACLARQKRMQGGRENTAFISFKQLGHLRRPRATFQLGKANLNP